MHDDETMTDRELTPRVRDVVDALRHESAVPDLWRARVLGDVGRASASRRRRRVATLAAAAVLVFGGGALLLRGDAAVQRDVASSQPAAAPHARLVDAAPVRFTLHAERARRVVLVGDFDGWTPEGRPMRRLADGRTWELDVALPPGRHAFAYLVDGVLRADPLAARAADDDFGVPSSVVVVGSRGI